MNVGSLVKFDDESLPHILPCETERYRGKVGVIVETKKGLVPHGRLFKIHIDGKNLEWFVYHELELVCK
tara:strand:+ start:895 stop:1101 length:207 start_codon:yes stop_codon:yes gene_type:complete